MELYGNYRHDAPAFNETPIPPVNLPYQIEPTGVNER
jgi:hypothetical protein